MKQQITENEENLFLGKNCPGVSSDLKEMSVDFVFKKLTVTCVCDWNDHFTQSNTTSAFTALFSVQNQMPSKITVAITYLWVIDNQLIKINISVSPLGKESLFFIQSNCTTVVTIEQFPINFEEPSQ